MRHALEDEPGFKLDEFGCGCGGCVCGDVLIVATPASDIKEDDVGVPPKELESLLLADWLSLANGFSAEFVSWSLFGLLQKSSVRRRLCAPDRLLLSTYDNSCCCVVVGVPQNDVLATADDDDVEATTPVNVSSRVAVSCASAITSPDVNNVFASENPLEFTASCDWATLFKFGYSDRSSISISVLISAPPMISFPLEFAPPPPPPPPPLFSMPPIPMSESTWPPPPPPDKPPPHMISGYGFTSIWFCKLWMLSSSQILISDRRVTGIERHRCTTRDSRSELTASFVR